MTQDMATLCLVAIAVFTALLLAVTVGAFAFPPFLIRMNDDLPEPVHRDPSATVMHQEPGTSTPVSLCTCTALGPRVPSRLGAPDTVQLRRLPDSSPPGWAPEHLVVWQADLLVDISLRTKDSTGAWIRQSSWCMVVSADTSRRLSHLLRTRPLWMAPVRCTPLSPEPEAGRGNGRPVELSCKRSNIVVEERQRRVLQVD